MEDPATEQEWQDAVDAAHFFLCLASARAYGLVTGGPQVNIERTQEILERGKAMGFNPSPDAIHRMMKGE